MGQDRLAPAAAVRARPVPQRRSGADAHALASLVVGDTAVDQRTAELDMSRPLRQRRASRPTLVWLLVFCFLASLAFATGCDSKSSSRDQVHRTDQRVDPRLDRALRDVLDLQRAGAGLTGVAAAVVIPGQGLW